jgi:hypothetical protein
MNIFGGGDRTKHYRVLGPVLKYIALIFPILARSMLAESHYACMWTVLKPVSCQNVMWHSLSLVVKNRTTIWQK